MTMKDSKEYIRRELKLEDLEPEHQYIIQIIGLEKFLDLCFHFGGVNVYIPTLETIQRQIIRKKVHESRDLVESKVLTVKQLSRIYGVSTATIYGYLRGN